jgi:hypothetical protein
MYKSGELAPLRYHGGDQLNRDSGYNVPKATDDFIINNEIMHRFWDSVSVRGSGKVPLSLPV